MNDYQKKPIRIFANYVNGWMGCKKNEHIKFIYSSIHGMAKEFDKYIKRGRDVPWWYNERAILGLFAAGITCDSNNIVLQEYSCVKGKGSKKGKRGRADLWIWYKGKEYLAEAKAGQNKIQEKASVSRYIAIRANSYKKPDWKKFKDIAKNALKQAKSYIENKNKWRPDFILSLCFQTLYCKSGIKDIREAVNSINNRGSYWRDVSNILTHFDFYGIIILKKKWLNEKKDLSNDKGDVLFNYDRFAYPAMIFYGLIEEV